MRRGLTLPAVLLILGTGAVLAAQSGTQAGLSTAWARSVVVAGPIPEKVTSNSVVVWWHTIAPVETIVVYGTSPDNLPRRVQRPRRSTAHEISLKRLQPATTYYFAIVQPDGTRIAGSRFTTQPLDYAAHSGVRITNGPLFEQITPDSAIIAWSCNQPSSFQVRYGINPQSLNQIANLPWTPVTHRVLLHSLQPDTHYYFTVEPAQPNAPSTPSTETTDQSSAPLPPTSPIYAFRTLARGQEALNIGPQQ